MQLLAYQHGYEAELYNQDVVDDCCRKLKRGEIKFLAIYKLLRLRDITVTSVNEILRVETIRRGVTRDDIIAELSEIRQKNLRHWLCGSQVIH